MHAFGARLREAREARGMSTEDLVQITKVPRATLVALEEGDTTVLPAPVFVRGFVRAIARALDIDANTLVRELPATLSHAKPNLNARRHVSMDTSVGLLRSDLRSNAPTNRHKVWSNHVVLVLLALSMCFAAFVLIGDREPTSVSAHTPAQVTQPVQDGLTTYSDVNISPR